MTTVKSFIALKFKDHIKLTKTIEGVNGAE